MGKLLYGISLFIYLLLSLTGCATDPVIWYKPGIDQDKQTLDLLNCRGRAQKVAEETITSLQKPTVSGSNNTADYEKLMHHYNAKRQMESLYRRCLKSKGYQLMTPKAAPLNAA